MKKILTIIVLLTTLGGYAQSIFYTKTGYVWVFSFIPIEDIKAHNHHVSAAFDSKKNILEYKMRMTDFVFEKAMMQEHFNENFVESYTYPYATFVGKIDNFSDVDLNNFTEFEAKVSGMLKIHGTEKAVTTQGKIMKNGKSLVMKAKFQVKPVDYKIKIPKLVVKNIAEVIHVNVDVSINPIKK